MINMDNLFVEIKESLDRGEVVTIVKAWTPPRMSRYHVFNMLNIVIKVDDHTIIERYYQSNEKYTLKVEIMLYELINKVYETLKDEAMKMLCSIFGVESVASLSEKVEVFDDEYGKVMVRTVTSRIFTATFSSFHINFYVGKCIQTFTFHKPIVLPME